MILLDMRTVIFSYVISNAICAIVMAFLWFQNHRQIKGLGFWLADFLMQFAALLLITLRGVVPDFASMVVGNGLSVGGTLLLYIGLERYAEKPGPQLHNTILLAAFISVHSYFSLVQPNLMARNINLSLGLLILCAQCAWLMLRRTNVENRQNTKIVGYVFVLYSLINFVRIFIELKLPAGNDLFKSGLFDTLVVLTFQMLFVSLTFALFLMVNRGLFTALEKDIAVRKQTEEALKVSEEKFSIAFQNIPDVVIITSIKDGKIIEANESFYRVSEYSRTEAMGKTTIELNLWGKLRDREQFSRQLQKSGRVVNFKTNFRRKSGELFTGWISGGIIQIQMKSYALTIIHDVSISIRNEEKVRLDNQMMANISDGIFIYKPSVDKIVYATPQFEKLFGYEPNELVGKPVSLLNAPTEKTPEQVSKEINKIMNKNGIWNAEIQNVKKDGTLFWSHASISSFNHSEYGPVWVCVQQDISERKHAEAKLQHISTHDSLTGLYNRAFFDEELKRYEKGRQYPLSIVMVDLDDLKNVNDRKGHLAGDSLLKRTAQVLNEAFRGDDIIARIGGDEFAALLPNTDKKAASEALGRVREIVQKNNKNENGIKLSISLGVNTAEKGTDLKKVLQKADKNMYQEKSKKK
jgi:diguanylate cyclase (GGDEF)-like protein/PAS domain S-box-containing protein